MKLHRSILLLIVPFLLLGCSSPHPVSTKKVTKEFVEFDHHRIDDYYWLNNPADPAVLEHLRAENAYADAMLARTQSLRDTLYGELVGRIDQHYASVPVKENGYWYYIRYEEGKQYPLYCRKPGTLDAPEEVYLDVPRLAEGHQIFLVRGYAFSPDNTLLAYGIDTAGDRRSILQIKDVRTSTLLPDLIPNTSGSYVWGKDGGTLLYVLNDPTVRAYRVMHHTLGMDPAQDRKVYQESDSTFDVSLSATKDHEIVFIASSSTLSSEWWYCSGDRLSDPPRVIQPRRKDLLYSIVDHEGPMIFIHTNHNALNFKLVRAPLWKPGLDQWQDVIPHRADALLEREEVFTKYIVAQHRINGLNQIQVTDRQTGMARRVDFSEEAYVATLTTATDSYDLDSIRYVYSSLTTPQTTYRYDLASGATTLLKQDSIGGQYDPSRYETRRLWAPSDDSVRVPITIVYRKDLFGQDASRPMFLYAYGSYGISTNPSFNASVISLLDRGFVFGIAHIRGGQEMGRQWYEDGKLLKKKNTFADFVACAQYLVDQKFTSPEKLFANGGSAGGMLMGAVTNMRPDLFRGVLAEVPWMDVITDMENPDLPLTTLEYDEWGNPGIREEYEYMLSWSPYDNVVHASYPAIFATGGLNDTQVPYFSPAKWVAKIREHNTGPNPVLFRVNMGAGHSGESGRFARQRLTAEKYAFMIDLVNTRR